MGWEGVRGGMGGGEVRGQGCVCVGWEGVRGGGGEGRKGVR